jgi:hypothetical protein
MLQFSPGRVDEAVDTAGFAGADSVVAGTLIECAVLEEGLLAEAEATTLSVAFSFCAPHVKIFEIRSRGTVIDREPL